MLILLSPAKTINIKNPMAINKYSQPGLIEQSRKLVLLLKSCSPSQLASLMGLSDKLAVKNVGRFAMWEIAHHPENAKQAIFAYAGDVYRGLNPSTLSEAEIDWAQSHIRILSGLYGLLKPLDLIQPYRLEMGTKLLNPKGSNLYAYWKETITEILNQELERQETDSVINLASEEYSRAIDISRLNASIITPIFQEWNKGKWKVIPIHAKRARGLMARYAAHGKLHTSSGLQTFDLEGYNFDRAASDDSRWFFRRR